MKTSLLAMAVFSWTLSASALATPESATSELHALFDKAWEREMRDDPLRASDLGDHRYDALWPDLSSAAIEQRYAADVATLARLQRIDRASLPSPEQLNYDLFAYQYQRRIRAYPFKPRLYELRAREGVQTLSATAEELPFATVADYENWIVRLRGLDRYIAQYTDQLRIAIRERRVQPKSTMEQVEKTLKSLIAAGDDATHSPFYGPFAHIPDSIAAAERTRLQTSGKDAIERIVTPAYRRFEKFFRTEYLPHSRSTVGIWDTPDGDAFYRERAAFFTTTTMSPAEIHELGLKEVARIRAQIDEVMRRTGFNGTFAEFTAFLRTDPQFYYQSADELYRAYVLTTKAIEPELVKLFRTLPRTPVGVRVVPENVAPNSATAYYQAPAADGSRAGYYYVNLYRPEIRPRYEVEVLTAHEAVPGHHLQIALGKELHDLPAFRRDARNVAFAEGWGLYAEGLGERLGLYTGPYSKYGELSYDLWRAVRLVVDTGIHFEHWDRQQAVEYFKANSSKSDAEIETEVARYIDWPGQALAYKIGQLRFLALRDRAQHALGAHFDIREFHDVLLRNGPVPFDVLDSLVDNWLAGNLLTNERG